MQKYTHISAFHKEELKKRKKRIEEQRIVEQTITLDRNTYVLYIYVHFC